MKRILYICMALALVLTACADNKKTNTAMTDEKTPAPAVNADSLVEIVTSEGTIKVLLYGDTPLHRDNFLKLANEGYYDEVLFHRVIKDFMVQAGDPESKGAPAGKMLGSGDPGYTIPAEIVYPKHFHKRGALAAARTGDQVNPQRRSSGSQFYIVTGQIYDPVTLDRMEEMMQGYDANSPRLTAEQRQAYSTIGGTPHLDGQYTVFGEVVSGMDVVDKIQQAQTDRADRPINDIKIISTRVVEQ